MSRPAATVSVADRFRIDRRVAIVTGGTSALGFAIAVAMAESGAVVALTARRPEELGDRCSALRDRGLTVEPFTLDVTDQPQCVGVVSAVAARFGSVDILVNNAGIGTAAPATREDPEQFRHAVDVNLMGAYWMSQACARVMNPGSSVVMISSILGLTTTTLPQAGYVSSKAALLGLTRDLARQWTGRKQIRVNAIAPGFLSTGLTEITPEGFNEDFVASRVPAGRLGEASEVAAAVVFLASPAASFISGAVLPVDGGALVT